MLKVAIVGYGNVGKSLHQLILKDNSLQLVAIFSRRKLSTPLYVPITELGNMTNKIDVLLIALGSAQDIMQYMPDIAGKYNTVDCYDNHNLLDNYKYALDGLQRTVGKTSVVAVGWDPGILSIQRALLCAFVDDQPSTFWGKGLSQGHSNAIRQVEGVTDGIQLTVPDSYTMRQKWHNAHYKVVSTQAHRRVCYVVCDNSKRQQIKERIQSIPDYFDKYNTTVNFVTQKQLDKLKQKAIYHAGCVIANDGKVKAKFQLDIDSNAGFTSAIMLKYAKIIPLLQQDKLFGCLDCLDIAPRYLIKDKSIL